MTTRRGDNDGADNNLPNTAVVDINSCEHSDESSPYQRLTKALQCDPRCGHEVTVGRRIGLYRFCGDIGRGNFSKVKLAVHQLTRDKVAIKVVDRAGLDSKALRMLSSEIATLECVHHPNILRLFEVIESLGRVYLVTEWIRGGELFNHISQNGPLKEKNASILFKQLLLAVKHMHQLGFVHRDVKAENVLLLSEDRLKLADFGFSTQLVNAQQKLDTFCGSPPYAAPELFSDDHYIGGPVDIWALGILLYFMVVGNMPFRAPTLSGLKAAILNGDYLLPGQLSVPCTRLIQRILIHVPSKRPTVDDLLKSQFITHPNLSLELLQQELAANSASRNTLKKSSFWLRPKSSRQSVRRQHSLERYLEMSSKPPIAMNTKQTSDNRLFVSNFLQPIELTAAHGEVGGVALPETPSQHQQNHTTTERNPLCKDKSTGNGTPHRSFLCSTLKKKKVVPVDLEKDKESVNGYANSNGTADHHQQWGALVPTCSSAKPPAEETCSLFKNYDLETGHFIMMPSRRAKMNMTNDKDVGDAVDEVAGMPLTPLEQEARKILLELGINDQMLEEAKPMAPRSDIIGVYRIVINRLQKQSWLTRKHVQLALQEMPKVEKKIERSCCIL